MTIQPSISCRRAVSIRRPQNLAYEHIVVGITRVAARERAAQRPRRPGRAWHDRPLPDAARRARAARSHSTPQERARLSLNRRDKARETAQASRWVVADTVAAGTDAAPLGLVFAPRPTAEQDRCPCPPRYRRRRQAAGLQHAADTMVPPPPAHERKAGLVTASSIPATQNRRAGEPSGSPPVDRTEGDTERGRRAGDLVTTEGETVTSQLRPAGRGRPRGCVGR